MIYRSFNVAVLTAAGVFVLAGRHTSADDLAAATDAPRMVIDEREQDAGQVSRGAVASFTFHVSNQGTAPLEIEAKPTCGCTVVDYDHTIAPGGETQIRAELRTAGVPRGPLKKSLIVTSNDPDEPRVELKITADSISAIEVGPTSEPRLSLKSGEPSTLELVVKTRSPDVEITEAICRQPYALVAIEPVDSVPGDEAAGGRAYRLTLTVGPEAPLGRSTTRITLKTTSELEPDFLLSVHCEKGIVVTPAVMALRTGSDSLAPRAVLVRTRGGKFQVINTSSSDPHVEVSVRAVIEGSMYRVTANQTGALADGARVAKITIETDDPQQPVFEVPFRTAPWPENIASR